MKEKLQRIKDALETCKERLDYLELESKGVYKNYNSKIMANNGLALIDELIATLESDELVERVAITIFETTDSPFAKSWVENTSRDLGRKKAKAALEAIKDGK